MFGVLSSAPSWTITLLEHLFCIGKIVESDYARIVEIHHHAIRVTDFQTPLEEQNGPAQAAPEREFRAVNQRRLALCTPRS